MMLTVKRAWIETGLTTLLYLLFFITPLVFVFITRELFEFPKMTIVYLAATLLTYFYLVLQKGRLMTIPSLLKPFLILTAAQSISTLFSSHLYTSFWGYYSRFNGGLASLFAFFLIYLVLSQILTPNRRNLILGALVTSGTFISLYALAQNLGIDKNFWVQDSQARAFSTLGQPNWLAAYILMVLPIPFYFYLKAQTPRPKILYFLLTLLFYFALWSTYSLSGFLGLIFLILLLMFFSRSILLVHWRKIAVLVLSILLLSSLRPGIFGVKVSSFIKTLQPKISERIESVTLAATNNPPVTPVTPTRNIDTGDIRLSVWEGALNLWRSNPKVFLLGAGPETFAYNFLPFRPRALNQTTEWDFLYNKAHNFYLDLLTGGGLLGLIAFFIFSLSTVKLWWQQRAKNKDDDPVLGDFLFYGWATAFVTNFFGWPTVSLSLLFFTYPLLISTGNNSGSPETSTTNPSLPLTPKLLLTTVPFVLLLILVGNVFLADVSFSRGLSYSQRGQLSQAEANFKDATTLNFYEPSYHKEWAFVLSQEAVAQNGSQTLVQNAAVQATIAYQLNPKNSLTLRSLIRTYFLLSQVSPSYEKNLEDLINQTLVLSPTDPQVRYDAALVYSLLQKRGRALELVRAALELKPNYVEATELLQSLTKKELGTGKVKK